MKNKALNYPLDLEEVKALLRKHGISPTRQRLVIAHHLFQKQQHLSADHILEGVNALDDYVSRATVYNTMGLFTRKGLVREVLVDRERAFYDSNSQPHHHIYNMDTGELKDIDTPLDIAAVNLPEGMRVVDTDLVIKVSRD